jgi:hypothetical protein
MAGYIGKSQGVTQVDGYTADEADSEFVNDPNAALNISSSASADSATIDASGNLLVGTTDTGLGLTTTSEGHLFQPDGAAVHARDGVHPLILNRLTSDGNIAQFRKDGSTVGIIGTDEGTLYIGRNDTGVIFEGFAADTLVPYNPSTNNIRDNTISLGYSSSRFKDLYLSGGVYLGGTGSANYLDDYEEGTWTPSIVQTGLTYSYRVGRYVKIGNQVTLWYYIQATGTNTSSSTAQLTGIPFNVVGSSFIERLYGNQAAHETGLSLAGGLNHPSLQSENSTSANYLLWYDTAKRNSATMFPSDFVVSGTISYRTS